MPDALKQRLCEPTEKDFAIVAVTVKPLLGIIVIWEKMHQI